MIKSVVSAVYVKLTSLFVLHAVMSLGNIAQSVFAGFSLLLQSTVQQKDAVLAISN